MKKLTDLIRLEDYMTPDNADLFHELLWKEADNDGNVTIDIHGKPYLFQVTKPKKKVRPIDRPWQPSQDQS